jgi:uncharacterized phiE125 gp8 family phage protein
MAQILFCTLAELKRYLGIDAGDTSKDELLTDFLTDASSFIEDQTGRHFGGTVTVTDEPHDFNQSGVFFTEKADVRSITAIKTGLPGSLTTQPSDSFVFQDSGRIMLGRIQPFDTAPWVYGSYQSVFVTYVYGRDDVPGDVKNAVKQLAAGMYFESPVYQQGTGTTPANKTVTEEQIGDYRVKYGQIGGAQAASAALDSLPGVQKVISYWKLRRT